MKILNYKKQQRIAKKIAGFAILFILTMALGFSYLGKRHFSLNSNLSEIANANNEVDKLDSNLVKRESIIEASEKGIEEHLKKVRQELDDAQKMYVKTMKRESKKVEFDVRGSNILISARQATLKEVLDSFVSKFGVKLVDYTSTDNQLDVKKTFYLSGDLFELVDNVLKKYGYENFVINAEYDSKSSSDLMTVFLLESPKEEVIPVENTSELVASVIQSEGLVTNLLKRQGIPIYSTDESSTVDYVDYDESVKQALGIAEAKRELEARENTIALSPGVDIRKGIPKEVQQQLSGLTQKAMTDVQGLTTVLANTEAQLKANQFLNQ